MPAQIERELLWASGPDIWIDFFNALFSETFW